MSICCYSICKIASIFKNRQKHYETFENYSFLCNKRSSHQRCSVKKEVLKKFAKFSGKHLCQSHFWNKAPGLRAPTLFKKKNTLSQVFSCKFCGLFQNTFFTEHLWTSTSVIGTMALVFLKCIKKVVHLLLFWNENGVLLICTYFRL